MSHFCIDNIGSEKFLHLLSEKEKHNSAISEAVINELIEQGDYLQAAQKIGVLDFYEEANAGILSTFFTKVFCLFRENKKGIIHQPYQVQYLFQLFTEVVKILSTVNCIVTRLYFERIGELSVRAGLVLARRQLGTEKEKAFVLFFSGKPANYQLLNMLKRKICIVEHEEIKNYDGIDPIDFLLPQTWITKFREVTLAKPTEETNYCVCNEYFEFNNTRNLLALNTEEKQRGQQILSEMGLKKDDWFVCMFARDSSYITETFSGLWGPEIDVHNRDRNADIDDFREAAELIVRLGGHVIRIGKIVEKPLIYANKRIIDYSLSKYRSDFMDIFLLATCKFIFGSPSGILDPTLLFDTPALIVNMVPPGHGFLGKNGLTIPKKLIDLNKDTYVPYRQAIAEMGERHNLVLWDTDVLYREKGWVYEDNSPEEIADAVEEMIARLDRRFFPSHQDMLDQLSYRAMIGRDHWSYNVKTPICREFIKKNRHLFA